MDVKTNKILHYVDMSLLYVRRFLVFVLKNLALLVRGKAGLHSLIDGKGVLTISESGGCCWQSLEPVKKKSFLTNIRMRTKDYMFVAIFWLKDINPRF